MSKKLDTSKLAKIVEIERSKKLLLGTVVEIEEITFVYDNGDIGGKFRVIESKDDKLPEDLLLDISRVTLENIKENEKT